MGLISRQKSIQHKQSKSTKTALSLQAFLKHCIVHELWADQNCILAASISQQLNGARALEGPKRLQASLKQSIAQQLWQDQNGCLAASIPEISLRPRTWPMATESVQVVLGLWAQEGAGGMGEALLNKCTSIERAADASKGNPVGAQTQGRS